LLLVRFLNLNLMPFNGSLSLLDIAISLRGSSPPNCSVRDAIFVKEVTYNKQINQLLQSILTTKFPTQHLNYHTFSIESNSENTHRKQRQ
jgi:hypothetical protein